MQFVWVDCRQVIQTENASIARVPFGTEIVLHTEEIHSARPTVAL